MDFIIYSVLYYFFFVDVYFILIYVNIFIRFKVKSYGMFRYKKIY